jgi:hypothetical protein
MSGEMLACTLRHNLWQTVWLCSLPPNPHWLKAAPS